MPTITCTICRTTVNRAAATIRTTLIDGVPAPIAWCRTCRPVAAPAPAPVVPAQRRRVVEAERIGA